MMKRSFAFFSIVVPLLLLPSSSPAGIAVIGWQTYDTIIDGNNQSGIRDSTPDTNSTYDATPFGSHVNNWYLTGKLGLGISSLGRSGWGQATNNTFLNDATFGSDLKIVDYTLADGSPGERIGPLGGVGASSWEFGNNNMAQLQGDLQVTNVSDFYFQLEYVHFDARGFAEVSSPKKLTMKYLSEPSNLIKASNDSEVQNGRTFYQNTWDTEGTENVSQSIAEVLESTARLAPGDSATFRFLWTGLSGAGAAQIDNLAFSGTFLDPNNGFNPIDPWDLQSVPEPTSLAIWGLVGLGCLGRIRRRQALAIDKARRLAVQNR